MLWKQEKRSVNLTKSEVKKKSRTAANNYFHYQLNCLLFSELTDQSFSPVFNPDSNEWVVMRLRQGLMTS